jgi:hypothetical protein
VNVDRFLENTQISNLMKNHPVGDKFHTDRQMELTVAFHNFENAPNKNKEPFLYHYTTDSNLNVWKACICQDIPRQLQCSEQ